MDAKEVMILTTDLTTQMVVIDEVFINLEDRAQNLNADDVRQLESVAYQIHNIYNAIEDLLRLVAAHFENQISDSALLQRMTQPVPGVRPALLTKDTFRLLNALRGFRHFFRHAYIVTVDPVQLQSNLHKARQAYQLLHNDVSHFLAQLQTAEESE